MVALRSLACNACLIAITLPAQSPATPWVFDSFEVATIKPTPPDWTGGRFFRMQTANQFVARGYTLRVLISAAYNLNPKVVSGGPAWVDSDRYDIVAKTPGEIRPNLEQQMAMLRKLIADRFNLAFHRKKKEMSIYALTIAKKGPKLRESEKSPKSIGANPEGPPPLLFVLAPDLVRVPARDATTTELTYILQRAALDRPVLDQPGLTARYDFDLEFSPDESLFDGALRGGGDGTRPGLFAAIQEQLGLKLKATRGEVDSIVIDKIDRPSEN
jgi:uncharacterized protein (TIGR03435 family)